MENLLCLLFVSSSTNSLLAEHLNSSFRLNFLALQIAEVPG